MRRLVGSVVVGAMLLGACSFGGGGGGPTYSAVFTRAVQVFPSVKVRVLGVSVGHVVSVTNISDGVRVTFAIDDSSVKIPANVDAAIVPQSLLGERYIQLFPAYQGGATLQGGSTIPLSRTAVPAEPDELLSSLTNDLGQLKPDVVKAFIEEAAKTLQGNGQQLNALIHHGAGVIGTLAAKRDDLAQIIVEFDKLSLALANRQTQITQLIHTYNAVIGTLTSNRAALEGTISGLNASSVQLANLLIAHRQPLHKDIETLARTGQTLDRNVVAFAQTGIWAKRLFLAASRAVDFNQNWLRLNNQGQELGALIVLRLEQRLTELCLASGSPQCSSPAYWQAKVPSLFCFQQTCNQKAQAGNPVAQLTKAIAAQPNMRNRIQAKGQTPVPLCDVPDPRSCDPNGGTALAAIVSMLLGETLGQPQQLAGSLGL